jgi:hypothetical protein
MPAEKHPFVPGGRWPGGSCTTSFIDSNEAAFRRAVRDAIRKSPLTRSEQAVTLVLANLWFHHKARGVMHPGRRKIARQAGSVSIKTVTRTMTKLKEAGCLVPVSHEKGGSAATRYRLKPLELMVFCGAKLPSWVEGELVPLPADIVPPPGAEMSRFAGDKMSHGLNDVGQCLSETSEAQVAPALPRIGGHHV